MNVIVFNNIKLPINASVEEAFSVVKRKLSSLNITSRVDFFVYRRSIDARKKDNIYFVYSIGVRGVGDKIDPNKLAEKDAVLISSASPEFSYGTAPISAPPVIVGAGPCGLLAALLLAENGYRPIVLERGGSVSERKDAVDKFNRMHILDTETNIQFGAGGAGTFSDGKLVTRINDPLSAYVLDKFVEFGAPEEIKYIAKPHIGTDILSGVIERMIDRIVSLGGRIEYHTRFISPISRFGEIVGVKTSIGDISAGALILAVGHSARDTYESLLDLGMKIEAKPFSVGMRIEHLSSDIDTALYGRFAGNKALGRAEYNLSHNTKDRGVYTFCMCPGGVVVAAASEHGGLVVNGMSYNSRSGVNSNSAVACSIFKEDYGATPKKAIEFQRMIERAAFSAAGGQYAAPIITVGDFLADKCKSEPSRILPTYMGGENVRLVSPAEYLPEFVISSIKSALIGFDKKISGFAASDAVLTGAETRTSAPIRIIRDKSTRLAPGYLNFYPAGEGAGYAGGITSAAIDGIKSAISIINTYKPIDRR